MKNLLAKILQYKKLLIAIAFILVILLSPIREYLNLDAIESFIDSIRDNPFSGLIFGAIYVAGVVLALPGAALTILAGVTFGFVQGSIIVIIASNIGCHITFLLSRYVARDFVKSRIKTDSFVDRMSTKIQDNGFLIMLYMRLLPLFPFNLINYATGLTPISYKHYAIATLIGMLPGTLVYVYLAASASNIKDNPLGLIISIGVLIVFTIGVKLLSKKTNVNFSETSEADK